MSEEILEPYLRAVRIKKVINYIPRGIVADIGCGNGEFLNKISNKIIEGIGFDDIHDRKKERIELRRAKLSKKIPLRSESVDCVTMLASLEHFEYPLELLMESGRVLKKGGVLLITSPTPRAKKILEFLSYKLRIVSPKQIKDHKNYFNKYEIREILIKRAKFKKIIAKTFQWGLNNLVIAYK
ncbi:MAG: class I SAM-dependent methyltransferase [Nanoarchaeota archaeon]|nr:class I SAM-dependent methyltransferase [Nanoarchaeota archaeon]